MNLTASRIIVSMPEGRITPQQMWWHADGCPPPEWGPRASRRPCDVFPGGPCVICGNSGDVIDASQVASESFMDWDRCPNWRAGTPAVFCVPCAWTLRDRGFRTNPRTVSGRPISAVLSEPIHITEAVSLPLSRQIHVAPFVRWGHVHTDRQALQWGPLEVERFHLVAWLRGVGFGETALTEAAPRWQVLRKIDDRARVLDAWSQLAAWRGHTDHLAVALRATRQPKQEGITHGRGTDAA